MKDLQQLEILLNKANMAGVYNLNESYNVVLALSALRELIIKEENKET